MNSLPSPRTAVLGLLLSVAVVVGDRVLAADAPPKPPASVIAADHRWDDGTRVDVNFSLSPDDVHGAKPQQVARYIVERAAAPDGKFETVGTPLVPDASAYSTGKMTAVVEKCQRGQRYLFRVIAVSPDGARSVAAQTSNAVAPVRQWFDGDRIWLAAFLVVICGASVFLIARARRGHPVKVRRIPALEAVEEAVGRATEMGRPCLFVPGLQDLNEIQNIAGLNVLSRVARVAAEYDAQVDVPTNRSLVMTAARETVQAACLAAGRPDAYVEDRINYITDEQFGFAAYLVGKIAREKPAACFYMGCFYAESLLLAETGNSIGAIQIAGTAEPAQLPFFVAACDYTLIGEELFAASAYLSGDPDQLGTLQGQDFGKVIVAVLLIVGTTAATLTVLLAPRFPQIGEYFSAFADYLRNAVLK